MAFKPVGTGSVLNMQNISAVPMYRLYQEQEVSKFPVLHAPRMLGSLAKEAAWVVRTTLNILFTQAFRRQAV